MFDNRKYCLTKYLRHFNRQVSFADIFVILGMDRNTVVMGYIQLY